MDEGEASETLGSIDETGMETTTDALGEVAHREQSVELPTETPQPALNKPPRRVIVSPTVV
jgi:hypothetical protein